MWLWGNDSLPSLAEDQWGLPAVQIWCFYLLYDWDIDFQTGHFADFDQFKVDSHSATLGKSKIDPTRSYYWLWPTVILVSLGKTLGCKKQSKTPFKNSETWHKL